MEENKMMMNRRNTTKKLAIAAMAMVLGATPLAANACCSGCYECYDAWDYTYNSYNTYDSCGNSYDYMDRSSDTFTVDSSSYVLYDSDCRYVTQEELSSYSGLYLMLARNEIYAKNGYIFNDQNIQRYFDYKDWYYGYVPSQNFAPAVFNEYEEYNIQMILAEENRRGGAVQTLVWFD
jgi:hypothetical protein